MATRKQFEDAIRDAGPIHDITLPINNLLRNVVGPMIREAFLQGGMAMRGDRPLIGPSEYEKHTINEIIAQEPHTRS